jgi:hypothetical protein
MTGLCGGIIGLLAIGWPIIGPFIGLPIGWPFIICPFIICPFIMGFPGRLKFWGLAL